MKKTTSLLMLAVATACLISSCSSKKETKAENTVVTVKIASATKETVEDRAEFTGSLEANKKNVISPAMMGRIKSIHADVGDFVRTGQTLVQMDDAQLAQSKMQLTNLQTEYQRTLDLYKAGSLSKQQLDRIQMQLDVAKTQYANLAENTKLISPISGLISERNYDNGDMYSNKPILSIVQINPVRIKANLSEEYYPRIRKGLSATITLDLLPGKTFNGNVDIIAPTINTGTRTFMVELNVANAHQVLRPGMFARVNFNFGKSSQIIVPDMAIVRQMGTNQKYIYVLKGNTVEYREVTLGRRIGDRYIVLAGIAAGDKVVVSGQSRLLDGTTVKVLN